MSTSVQSLQKAWENPLSGCMSVCLGFEVLKNFKSVTKLWSCLSASVQSPYQHLNRLRSFQYQPAFLFLFRDFFLEIQIKSTEWDDVSVLLSKIVDRLKGKDFVAMLVCLQNYPK